MTGIQPAGLDPALKPRPLASWCRPHELCCAWDGASVSVPASAAAYSRDNKLCPRSPLLTCLWPTAVGWLRGEELVWLELKLGLASGPLAFQAGVSGYPPCMPSDHWRVEMPWKGPKLDHKEGWAPKNWCFQNVILEKTLESPLDCKEIKPVNPKGNQPWIFIERTDTKPDAPILWSPDVESLLNGKDPDIEQDWRQKEKGEAEEKMIT